jgi:hypothetical protein
MGASVSYRPALLPPFLCTSLTLMFAVNTRLTLLLPYYTGRLLVTCSKHKGRGVLFIKWTQSAVTCDNNRIFSEIWQHWAATTHQVTFNIRARTISHLLMGPYKLPSQLLEASYFCILIQDPLALSGKNRGGGIWQARVSQSCCTKLGLSEIFLSGWRGGIARNSDNTA